MTVWRPKHTSRAQRIQGLRCKYLLRATKHCFKNKIKITASPSCFFKWRSSGRKSVLKHYMLVIFPLIIAMHTPAAFPFVRFSDAYMYVHVKWTLSLNFCGNGTAQARLLPADQRPMSDFHLLNLSFWVSNWAWLDYFSPPSLLHAAILQPFPDTFLPLMHAKTASVQWKAYRASKRWASHYLFNIEQEQQLEDLSNWKQRSKEDPQPRRKQGRDSKS